MAVIGYGASHFFGDDEGLSEECQAFNQEALVSEIANEFEAFQAAHPEIDMTLLMTDPKNEDIKDCQLAPALG